MFAFGHFALPLAAIIALAVLFIGAKLFFLAPADNGGASTPGSGTTTAGTGGASSSSPEDNTTSTTSGGNAQSSGTITDTGSSSSSGGSLQVGPIDGDGTTGVATTPSDGENNTATTGSGQASGGQSGQSRPTAPTGSLNVKYGVQIGAFTRPEGAEALVEEVTKAGYRAAISVGEASGKTYHRVRVAGGDTKEEAEKVAEELKKKKYPVLVITNP